MKVLSLYCGAGGIDEGLKQSGIKTTLAIDSWKDACETFKANHPDCEVIHGNVSDYIESINQADTIVGGPPCPEFSRANAVRTFDACEVNNFWKVVDKLNPKYYLMENVQDVIKVCNRSNYLLECSDYGVAQCRIRRIFSNIPKPEPQKQKTMIAEVVNTEYDYFTDVSFPNRNQKCVSRTLSEQCPTLTTMDCFYWTPIPIMTRKYLQEKDKIWIDKTTKTNLTNGMKCKKISNMDRQLLQGFPETYQFIGKDDSVRKQICNAVPPPVIKSIFEQVSYLEVIAQ